MPDFVPPWVVKLWACYAGGGPFHEKFTNFDEAVQFADKHNCDEFYLAEISDGNGHEVPRKVWHKTQYKAPLCPCGIRHRA